MSRYGRQIRLADVGSEGQARLEATTVGLATSGFAREIEARYLRGAGVQVDADSPSTIPSAELGLRQPAARDVAAGAHAALVAMRRVLLERDGS